MRFVGWIPPMGTWSLPPFSHEPGGGKPSTLRVGAHETHFLYLNNGDVAGLPRDAVLPCKTGGCTGKLHSQFIAGWGIRWNCGTCREGWRSPALFVMEEALTFWWEKKPCPLSFQRGGALLAQTQGIDYDDGVLFHHVPATGLGPMERWLLVGRGETPAKAQCYYFGAHAPDAPKKVLVHALRGIPEGGDPQIRRALAMAHILAECIGGRAVVAE